MPGSFLVRTKPLVLPTLYIHYDIPTRHYLVQSQKEGSCVFSEQMVHRFIKTLPASEQWIAEELGSVKHRSKDSREGKKFLKELEQLPGYTKTHSKGECAACGVAARSLCAGCKSTRYCNRECQKMHWNEHQHECAELHEANSRLWPSALSLRIRQLGYTQMDYTLDRLVRLPLKIVYQAYAYQGLISWDLTRFLWETWSDLLAGQSV